jgi:hypothetical protein
MELGREGDGGATARPIEQRVVEGGQREAQKLIVPVNGGGLWVGLLIVDRLEGANDIGEGVLVVAREALQLWCLLRLQ